MVCVRACVHTPIVSSEQVIPPPAGLVSQLLSGVDPDLGLIPSADAAAARELSLGSSDDMHVNSELVDC